MTGNIGLVWTEGLGETNLLSERLYSNIYNQKGNELLGGLKEPPGMVGQQLNG